MAEAAIVRAIRDELHRRGAWTLKVHGSPMQVRGVPDIIGGLPPDGRLFGIEVKMPGERSTEIQSWVQSEIRAAGGIAGEAHSVSEALALLGLES